MAKIRGQEAWEKAQAVKHSPLGDRASLSEKVGRAIWLIDSHITKLNNFYNKLAIKDRVLFDKVVDACIKHDEARAKMYAAELAEVRRVCKALLWAKISLEQISIRLKTVKNMGDVVASIAPAIGIVRRLGRDVSKVLPEASKGLMEINDALASLAIDIGVKAVDVEAADEDALRILEQASALAEQKINESFQKPPSPREEKR